MCSESRDNKGLPVRSSAPLEDEPQADVHTGHFDYTQVLYVNGHLSKAGSVKAHCGKNQEWLRLEGGFFFCFSGTRKYNPETKLD